MSRARAASRIEADTTILDQITTIKSNHPLWGYRRIWAYIRYRQNIVVGKNRVYRIMRENRLLICKNSKLLAKRTPKKSKIKSSAPNKIWGMDMTKVKLPSFGWVYLHVVLDWYTKEIVGYSVSFQSKTDDWLDALNMAVNNRYNNGILSEKSPPKLITDNGCQPTSERFMRSASEINIKQIFTSWNNPKGNADTERVMRTIKEDIVWPYDWQSPFEFEAAFKQWVIQYNTDFPHQTLRYKTPFQFMHEYSLKHQEVKTAVLA